VDRLQAMQIFTRIAELGSFTRVAEQLRLPRASVTHAVQYLETHMRVRLLQRTTRKVTMTEEGAAFYERCVHILGELDDAESMFSDVTSIPRGTIRFELPERFAHRIVIPALPEFLKQHPELRIVLSASDRLVNLLDEGIDFVVRAGELADSSLVARRICSMERVSVASRSYIERHGKPESIEDLTSHVAVGFFSTRAGRDADWTMTVEGQVRAIKMRSNLSVYSAESYLQAAFAGLGMAQFPRTGIAEQLESGDLIQILPHYPPPSMPVSLVYPHGRNLPSRVRIFADWVSELIASQTR
jgi:LysR family transcriptional regulator for bpeEF and oprC